MQRRAVVHTHHKTGTIWMRRTFRELCKELKIPVTGLSIKTVQEASFSTPMIALDPTSRFPFDRWAEVAGADKSDRHLHLIRDPRDVIISAAHYHCKTDEKPFHIARDAYGGMTYQQKINSLPSDRDRYVFEMDRFSKNTIKAMEEWDYDQVSCMEAKYEDLMQDRDAKLFGKIAEHLGFEGSGIETAKAAFLKGSLFAGAQDQSHVRSGDIAQWKSVFDKELAHEFQKRFENTLIVLDYENDNSWIERLPDMHASDAA